MGIFRKIQEIRMIIRRNSRYNIFISLLFVNILGVVINVIYFSLSLSGGNPFYRQLATQFAWIWAIPAYFIYQYRERPVTSAIYAIKNKLPLDPETLALAKYRLKRRPRFVALMIFIIWDIGALQNTFVLIYLANFTHSQIVQFLVGITLVGNPIVSLLCYFTTEILSRNDMRVLEIDIDMETMGFRVRNKILFTMVFLSTLFIFLLTAVSLSIMNTMAHNVQESISVAHLSQTIAVSVIGLFYVVLSAFLVSTSITSPLKELLSGMKKVETGTIDTSVHITSTDEVGVLAKGFNLMTDGLKERERIKHVFGSYVSHEIRDAILEGKLELGGTEAEATILFSDIRNFTSLSERYAPSEVVYLLNTYFSEMVKAITNNGGVVDKFIGDAVMAIFGAPKPLEGHAKKAIDAAREMLRRLSAHNELQHMKGEPEFEIGIGINTGPIIMGNIGSDDRKEFTAIGDTVNTASRLESLTKKFSKTILFSESTAIASGMGFAVGEDVPKGKQIVVKLFTVDL